MVKLDKIRSDLESQLQIDKSLHYVDVRADTLEEALSDASVQLGVKISCLEYEVLEKGFSGFLGLAKQPWFIRVYENSDSAAKKRKVFSKTQNTAAESVEKTEKTNKHGEFFIRYYLSDIKLKVTLPVGSGKPVSLQDVMGRLSRSYTVSLKEA